MQQCEMFARLFSNDEGTRRYEARYRRKVSKSQVQGMTVRDRRSWGFREISKQKDSMELRAKPIRFKEEIKQDFYVQIFRR